MGCTATGDGWMDIASDESTYRAIAGAISQRSADPSALGRELHRHYGAITRGPGSHTALVERICKDKGIAYDEVTRQTAIKLKRLPKARARVLMVMSFDKAQFGRFVTYAEEPRANTHRPRLTRDVIGRRARGANGDLVDGHVCFIRDCGQRRNPAYFSTESKFRVGANDGNDGVGVFHVNQDIDKTVTTTYYNIV